MADNKYMQNPGCKEAVCVDAGRVYDSCSEKHYTRYKMSSVHTNRFAFFVFLI